MSYRLVLLVFLIILFLASVLRIWNISNNPTGFFVDEASHGLEAYSILQTGKDTHGNMLPVIFEAVGDYRDPVMIYSTVPFIYLFGLNEFSVRLVSVVYGVLAVVMMYLVGKQYMNEKVGLLAAFILAISPWHVHFSRVGFQLISSVFWLLFTLYFLHKSFSKGRYFILAAVGLVITFFSYSTTKMYLPFLILFHIFVYPKEWLKLYKNQFVIGVTIFSTVLFFLILYPYLESGAFFQRWVQVDKQFSIDKVLYSYINHFSLDFLFITGDAGFTGQQVLRHSVHGVGELYWFQLPFLVISVICFIVLKKERMKLLFWFLFLYIFPLGSMFTSIKPQATRSILGVIPFTIITAYGIYKITETFSSKILKKLYYLVICTVMLTSTFLFGIALQNYPLTGANYWGWQYGYRQTLEYVSYIRPLYEQIIITHRFNRGMELLDFYNHEFHCNECTVSTNPITIDISKKQLFVLRPEDITEAATVYPELQFINKHIIRLPNGNAELLIGEFTQQE